MSVLRAIRGLLPGEDILYVADSGHIPYGNKPREYIQGRSLVLAHFLQRQGAKAVVVACNTATAAAAEILRNKLTLPIIAMEPAVKPAAAATKSGIVGVLATVGTAGSSRFAALLERFGLGIRVVVQACPGLVEQVEAGDLESPVTRALVEQYTTPLIRAGADVIVLGCTHYPFLRPLIAQVAGPWVTLVDTGDAVAQQVRRVLTTGALLNQSHAGAERFWATGNLVTVQSVIRRLWGKGEVQPFPEPD